MQRFIKRHPLLSWFFVFVVGTLPQWTASVWALFSEHPLGEFIRGRLQQGEIKLPGISPYWVTGSVGFLSFLIVLRETGRRPLQEIPLNMEQLEDEELHDQAASWLAKALSDKKLSVQRAVLFGSIVHDHYQTSDVDVIIVSQTVSDRKAVRIGRKIKTDLRQQFYRRFGHPLHVQLYHANESLRLSRFLECLGKYEELPLNGNQ